MNFPAHTFHSPPQIHYYMLPCATLLPSVQKFFLAYNKSIVAFCKPTLLSQDELVLYLGTFFFLLVAQCIASSSLVGSAMFR